MKVDLLLKDHLLTIKNINGDYQVKELSKEKAKQLAKLKLKKYRCESDCVLVEGSRTIRQLIDDDIEILELYITQLAREKHQDVLTDIPYERCYILKDSYLKQLSQTRTPQSIIALVSSCTKKAVWRRKLLYLDRVADPTNLGTIFRTAAAFDINGIILSSGCCDIFNAKTIRASVGKVFSVPVLYESEFQIDTFPGDIIVADMGGHIPISELHPSDNSFVIILGSEADGISKELISRASKRVFIPMRNKLESLNVAIASSLFMYQMCIKGHDYNE